MKTDALLLYPKLGSMDTMVVDLPLSIIYAATDSVMRGYAVKAADLRGEWGDWQGILRRDLDQGVRIAGISTMTGMPLRHAREISLFIKTNYPETKVLWGGPHVTVVPETITEPYIDFTIRGYGSFPLAELINQVKSGGEEYHTIQGLSFKNNGDVVHNPRSTEHEILHYTDLPYDLIPVNSSKYTRSYLGKQIFPMFTSIGCPYRCTFCVHPAVYQVINGAKWRSYPETEVIDHISYVTKKFKVDHICFLDDTSFPDLDRMRRIFNLIIERGISVTMEFRGARVNELDRMDDGFLELMIKAGGRILMVGVESASDKILRTMQKGITKEQILRVNRKLARHPGLIPHYNLIYGSPGETYEDLIETKEVVLQLIRDNPQAYYGISGDWKPIPGSEMFDLAKREYGLKAPQTLDEWIAIDTFDAEAKIVHPWYTKKHNNMIKLMQVTSFVLDDKIIKESRGNRTLKFQILRLLAKIYKPVARVRIRFNIHHLLIEYTVWQMVIRIISHYKGKSKRDK